MATLVQYVYSLTSNLRHFLLTSTKRICDGVWRSRFLDGRPFLSQRFFLFLVARSSADRRLYEY
jgi:hypothetical protein